MVVYDGTTERAQAVAEICRSGRAVLVTSSGPYLHVASHVSTLPDRHRRQPVAGFQLLYRFEEDPGKRHLTPDSIRE